jgi:hypothetical protein
MLTSVVAFKELACGETQGEYAAGFDNTALIQRPGSGYALDFTASSNQNIQVPHANSLNATTEVSIMGWIRPTAGGVTKTIITKRQNSVGQETNYGMDYHNGQLRFFTNSGSGFNIYTTSTGDVTLNEWNHIAGTYKNGTVRIYVNGILQSGSGSLPASLTPNNRNLIIGGNENTQYFDGGIDEVSIWNVELSQAQIRERICKKITAGDPIYCDLKAYFKFDENVGNTLFDYVSGNNGTLFNSPAYQLSGAAIGDESDYVYSSTPNLSLSSADGDQLTVNSFTGSPTGVHLYVVEETPNSLTGTQGIGGNEKYFGVHKVGDNAATYI